VGKINQIFAGRGITEEIKVASNDENLAVVLDLLESGREGLIFTNLVDFDMAWGHRNDVEGFAAGLAAVDRALPAILDLLAPGDRLLVTADHGVDPTTVGTDHTREYVPLLYYPRPRGTPDAAYEGLMGDTGATVFAHLTGGPPPLGGRPLERLNPANGWRAYPGMAGTRPDQPSRVRALDAEEAAAFLRTRFGEAPRVAVILGSGLDGVADIFYATVQGAPAAHAGLDYDQIPHWLSISVPGHCGRLDVRGESWERIAFLRGRVHGYEGADTGEMELPVRTLARWGVRRLIVTNASGGLRPDTRPGDVAVVTRVLDCQSALADGSPRVVPATPPALVEVLRRVRAGTDDGGSAGIAQVAYVAVPGPQYETEAEVAVLDAMGGDVVGMSTAAELQAAADEGLETVVLTVITNAAGATAEAVGATAEAVGASAPVHAQVIEVSMGSAPRVSELIQALLAHWRGG
jgi:inosine/guanosine/xanthosine phosphorylase family protein